MNKYVGLLDKIRVIKTQPLLVRFTLQTIHEPKTTSWRASGFLLRFYYKN